MIVVPRCHLGRGRKRDAFYVQTHPQATRRHASAIPRIDTGALRAESTCMHSALIIRPSSLGDIVHALPVVARPRAASRGHRRRLGRGGAVRRTRRAQSPRAPRHPGRAAPMAAPACWRARRGARSAPSGANSPPSATTAVLDLQEQVKGALIASLARGPAHGPDRASIREPVATLAYRYTHRIDPAQHLIDRCRALAGAAFGYDPPARRTSACRAARAARRVPKAATPCSSTPRSRADKLWPERALARADRAFHARRHARRAAVGHARGGRAQRAPRQRHRRRARAAASHGLPQTRCAACARRTRVRRRHRPRASGRGARRADRRAFCRDRSAPRRSRTRERARDATSAASGVVPTPDEVIDAAGHADARRCRVC